MTDDSVIIILEKKGGELKEENLASVRGSLRPKRKTTLTPKSSGVKKLACVEKGKPCVLHEFNIKGERHDAFKLDLAFKEGRRIRKSKKS